MAYCRFSKTCKVYMYESVSGGYQFHLSGDHSPVDKAGGKTDFVIEGHQDALRKLKRLQTAGFGVPDYAIERLEKEVLGLTEDEAADEAAYNIWLSINVFYGRPDLVGHRHYKRRFTLED
jgi:hypothetical protein